MAHTVLVMEDDPFLRKAYELKLTASGFDVIMAENGEVGMVKLREKKPDIILLDLMMGRKSGFDVLFELGQDSDAKINAIPVIVLTNLAQDSDIKRAMGLGAKDYVVKADISIAGIIEKIKKLLGMRK